MEVGVIYETPPLRRHAQDQKEKPNPQLLLVRMPHTHMPAFVGREGLVSVYLTLSAAGDGTPWTPGGHWEQRGLRNSSLRRQRPCSAAHGHQGEQERTRQTANRGITDTSLEKGRKAPRASSQADR